MKRNRLFLLFLLALALMIWRMPERAVAQPDYIRLHVIANSDQAEDQAIKLQVRDAIRELAGRLLSNAPNADAAYRLLEEHQAEFLSVAERRAYRSGHIGSVAIEIGTFAFPDRVYGDELVPAGDYRAVRIRLGEARGGNWWCVVYPALCLPDDVSEAQAAGGDVVFYSSIGRWLSERFHIGG